MVLSEKMKDLISESTIQKIAVACTIIGLTVLFLFLQKSEPEFSTLSSLDEKEDDTVVVEGVVLSVNALDGVTFLMLEKTEIASATLFGPTPRLEAGDFVQIRGTVEIDQEGRVDIIGEEARVI